MQGNHHVNAQNILRWIAGYVILAVWAVENVSDLWGGNCGVDWWVHAQLFAVVAALYPEGVAHLVHIVRGRNGKG
jgi:hypothetical protein